jgi:hypothetical protein
MAPRTPREDNSALVAVLEHLRAQDDRIDDFRCEVRESMRAARADSQDFREEILGRVSKIEQSVAVDSAVEAAELEQRTRWGAIIAWTVGTILTVAGLALAVWSTWKAL